MAQVILFFTTWALKVEAADWLEMAQSIYQ
jgi:hypothetical protein